MMHSMFKNDGRRWMHVATWATVCWGAWLGLPGPDGMARQPASPATSPTVVAVPAYRQADMVAVISIKGDIDDVTRRSVERRLAAAADAGANAVVFEIDTWGGQATSALEICEIIRQSPIPNTVAWVHPKAISAGTLIALACTEIVTSPTAMIGDCAPIIFGPTGIIPLPTAERAKFESPLLAEVVSAARARGYDEKLVMAFVAVDIELWLVENTTTGDRLFVDREEYRTLFGDDPPETARSSASGSTAAPITTGGRLLPFHSIIPDPAPGKEGGAAGGRGGPTRQEEIESQQILPPTRPTLTAADRGHYRLLRAVEDSRTLMVLNAEEAKAYGLSVQTISTPVELTGYFGASKVVHYDQNWSESLVQMLTSTPMRVLLVLVFAVGLIWEMTTPGVGVPGALAAFSLLVLLGAPALTGLAQWWDIALVLIGVVLLFVEMFVIPGFGVAGVGGLVCLAVGFVGTFVPVDPGGGFLPGSADAINAVYRGLAVVLLAFFATGVALYFAVRHLDSVPMLNRMVLARSMRDEDQVRSGMLEAMGPARPAGPEAGDVGIAVTPLRPVGRARINGVIYDVMSRGGAVEAEGAVRVVSADEFQIVVETETDHG